MRVATEILEDVSRSTKRGLGVDHPLSLPDRRQIPGEGAGVLKRLERVEEAELSGVEGGSTLGNRSKGLVVAHTVLVATFR